MFKSGLFASGMLLLFVLAITVGPWITEWTWNRVVFDMFHGPACKDWLHGLAINLMVALISTARRK